MAGNGVTVTQRVVLSLFLGVFFVGGLAGFYWIMARPLWRMAAARGWTTVPCVIESATTRVITHRDDADSYEYSMTFRYDFAGTRYRSDRYGFSAFNRGLTREAMERYPKGAEATCLVDPRDPAMAVIDRGQPAGWGFGIFPLLAAAFAGFIGWILVVRRTAASPAS